MDVAREPELLDPRLRLLRAAGDAARLALLDRLSLGEASVGTLVASVGIPQPLVSRHLRILREAGWLRDERRGQRVYYRLDPLAVQTARLWAATLPVSIAAPLSPRAAAPETVTPEPDSGVLFVD